MKYILQDLPYSDQPTSVSVGQEYVPIIPHQIMVRVSLSDRGLPVLTPSASRFPALLDTGNAFGFALSERRLQTWSGCTRAALAVLGTVNINRFSVPRLAADVWIHRNRKGLRDVFRRAPPFRLELRDGIAAYPLAASVPVPRLPIIGLRAIDENELRLIVDGARLRVSLQSPGRPNQ
jgi:hypothetical protein